MGQQTKSQMHMNNLTVLMTTHSPRPSFCLLICKMEHDRLSGDSKMCVDLVQNQYLVGCFGTFDML